MSARFLFANRATSSSEFCLTLFPETDYNASSRRGQNAEADLAAKETSQATSAWFPGTHEHPGWPLSVEAAALQRSGTLGRVGFYFRGHEGDDTLRWRQQRLRKRSEFEEVQRRGSSRAHPLVVLRAASNGLSVTRFGYVVTKRVARAAVARNRIRRRLHEIIRCLPIRPGWDVVLIARHLSADAGFQRLHGAVCGVASRAGLLELGDDFGEEKSDSPIR